MNCSRIPMPGGGFAIVCGTRGRRAQPCGHCAKAPGAFQCDWKVGYRTTCDRYVCAEHAFQAGPDKHLCPIHVEAYRLWLRDEMGIAY